jgi:hypothetical protein
MKNLIRHDPDALPIPRQRTRRMPSKTVATDRAAKRADRTTTRERAQARREKFDPLRTVNSLLMALAATTVILSSLAGTVQ